MNDARHRAHSGCSSSGPLIARSHALSGSVGSDVYKHFFGLQGDALLTLASFLITRLGNVPINGRIKEWALTSAPADHAEILRRWELFNNLRTLTAFTAFGLLIVLSLGRSADHAAPRNQLLRNTPA